MTGFPYRFSIMFSACFQAVVPNVDDLHVSRCSVYANNNIQKARENVDCLCITHG